MKEMKNRAPFYYYQEQTVPSIVWDLLLTLFLCMIMPIINYGPRILIMTLFTGGLCLLAELIGRLLARREIAGADFSPVVTGMLIAMLMPANAPFWLFAAAALFSMFVVRIPFGGTGRTPVSYTHLDVYKRQILLRIITAVVLVILCIVYFREKRNNESQDKKTDGGEK